MSFSDWIRVSRKRPCPVCHRFKGCGVSPDGNWCICVRVSQGSVKPTRNGGYLHWIGSGDRRGPDPFAVRTTVITRNEPTRHDLELLARNFQTAVNPTRLKMLAGILGVSEVSLRRLRIGWSCRDQAWSFPMVDAAGVVRGIRLRATSGAKWAIRGGKEGLFIPPDVGSTGRLLVCEGPTDTAAMDDLGFEAVGRPSCTGGRQLIVDLVNRHGITQVVILGDNDANGAGQAGAHTLACSVRAYCADVRIVYPPAVAKDAREWKKLGATPKSVLAAIDTAPGYEMTVRDHQLVARELASQEAGHA